MSVTQTLTDPVSEDIASVTKKTRKDPDDSFVILWYENVKCYVF